MEPNGLQQFDVRRLLMALGLCLIVVLGAVAIEHC